MVRVYCDHLLLIARTLPRLLKYAAAIARYLVDVGMLLKGRKCTHGTTAWIPSVIIFLDPDVMWPHRCTWMTREQCPTWAYG